MQPRFSQNHDLAAIERIKILRKHTVRRVENAKVLFLTSDRGLSRFNFEMDHKANGTIGEVILDSLLTNIIWLSDPNANVSLKSIIAAHSHGLFVKREVWLRFYDALKKIRQEGKVDDQAITTLFYGNYIEDELMDFDQSRIEEINEKFALDEIEEASKLAKAEQEEKEAEFVRHLAEVRSKTEQEKEQQFLDRLETMRMKLGKASNKTGNIASIIFSFLLSLGLIAGCWFLYEKASMPWLVDTGLSFGGLGIIWWKFRQYCKARVASTVYARKLKETGLNNDKHTSSKLAEKRS